MRRYRALTGIVASLIVLPLASVGVRSAPLSDAQITNLQQSIADHEEAAEAEYETRLKDVLLNFKLLPGKTWNEDAKDGVKYLLQESMYNSMFSTIRCAEQADYPMTERSLSECSQKLDAVFAKGLDLWSTVALLKPYESTVCLNKAWLLSDERRFPPWGFMMASVHLYDMAVYADCMRAN